MKIFMGVCRGKVQIIQYHDFVFLNDPSNFRPFLGFGLLGQLGIAYFDGNNDSSKFLIVLTGQKAFGHE